MKALFFVIFLIPISVFANDISVYISDNVSRGQPMLARLTTTDNVTKFRLTWQDLELTIPAECENNICNADIILPTKYDDAGDYQIRVSAGGKSIGKTVTILDKAYPTQKLKVDPRFVTLSKADQERAAKEAELVKQLLRTFSLERKWELPLAEPLNAIISSPFGTKRVFNGEPRGKHSGVDFAGKMGDNISVVSDGTVILVANHYFGGNSVFVDHGLGLITIYFHLSKILVSEGEQVSRGQTIGLVGATGRVTGPHLHFSVSSQGTLVDAMPLF